MCWAKREYKQGGEGNDKVIRIFKSNLKERVCLQYVFITFNAE